MGMTIDLAIKEWESKNRRMGCVSATNWFCKRVKGFVPIRLDFGNFQHVVATDGKIRIDLASYACVPKTFT